MIKNFCAVFCCFLSLAAFAQNVGINTPTPTSSLDINGGLRLRQQITPVTGASVMLTSNRTHHVLSGTGTGDFTIAFVDATLEGQHVIITNNTLYKGFLVPIYIQPNTTVELIYSSAAWKLIGSNEPAISTAWSLNGNNGINPATQFMGTISDADLVFKRNNVQSGLINAFHYNTSWGVEALNVASVGSANTAIGASSLPSNLDGSSNTAIGFVALLANKSGGDNTAVGVGALRGNRDGNGNTAVGVSALDLNAFGERNTAVGRSAMYSNTTGNYGVAVGHLSMFSNRSGYSNVAIGTDALFNNITKSNLVAIGDSALYNNGGASVSPTGVFATTNTAVGSKSLLNNSSGFSNTALGSESGRNNTQGFSNTAIGTYGLRANVEGDFNTSLGASALVLIRGDNNTALGSYAGHSISTGDRNSILGVNEVTNVFFSRNISGSTFLGYNAGNAEISSNKLYIENSDADKNNALIYGDFANDSLLLNAKTINKFSFNVRGSNALEMGYGAAGKQTDAGKLCYGCFGDPEHWLGIVGGGTAALGGDRVLKLWSEGGLRIKGNALPNTDNGHSLGQSGLRWSSVWAVNGVINTSDANLKTNIVHSPYGLDEVMQMNPVQYNWKTNPDEDLQIGFLAQDIQKIIPEAVVVPANGDPLGMKYTELIPVLVKAIQEQQKKIEELEKMVKKLQK